MNRPIARGALFGLAGALIGSAALFAIFDRDDAATLGALTGAIFGVVIGARLIGTLGLIIIASAFIGGVLSIVTTRHGKGALYGAPLGAIVAFLGLEALSLARAALSGYKSANNRRQP